MYYLFFERRNAERKYPDNNNAAVLFTLSFERPETRTFQIKRKGTPTNRKCRLCSRDWAPTDGGLVKDNSSVWFIQFTSDL